FSLWHRKRGLVGPVQESAEMEWGKRLEHAVADKFFENHPEMYRLAGGTWTRSDRPWQVANPDARAEVPMWDEEQQDGYDERIVVEIKTAMYDTGWGQQGTDQIPVYYLCQVRWYLSVLGLRRAYVAVLIGGSDYREYIVERSESDEEILLTAGEAFIASISTGTRPDIDTHSETYQVIRELHPEIDGSDCELDPGIAEAYLLAEATSRLAEADLTGAKSRVLDAMGNAKYALHADRKIAFRTARTRADGTPGTPYLQLSKTELDQIKNLTKEARNAA
ncbi:MAG: YqaJ viral recombinase family protein, partial [Propionicimonas sp.]